MVQDMGGSTVRMSTSTQSLRARYHLGWTPADLRGPGLVSVAYFLGAEGAFLVGTLSDRIFAPFWPPNVILFAVLLRAPVSRWWLYVAAVVPAHVLAEWHVGMPLVPMAVAFVTNCTIAGLCALAVRRLLEGAPWFGSLSKASIYVLVTALLAPAFVAFGGALVPILGGAANGNYFVAWTQWFLSNSLGFLTLGPILLTWFGEGWRPWSGLSAARLIEAGAIAIALVVVSGLAFHLAAGTVEIGLTPALLYSPLPLVLWAAMRFGERGASAAVLVITIVLLTLALNTSTLFGATQPERNVLALQVFLISFSVPVLLLGASSEQVGRAEATARESEERMRFAASSANIGLWYFERTTGRLWATVHCRAMLGLPADAPLDRHAIEQIVHPDDRKRAIESMRSAAFAGNDVINEFRVVLPDGQIRWLRARARADRDQHGVPFRVSGVFIDITRSKEAEHDAALQRQELAHLMRVAVLGELAGAIAHDLNQPLTAILSNAEAARLLLAKPSPNLAEVTDAIADIVHGSKRAGAVIEHMRGLLKKDARPPEPIAVNALIRSTVDLLHSELIARRLTIAFELGPDLPPAFGDAVQLQQVLLNLLMNAMDAMTETPLPLRSITVSTKPTGDGAVEVGVSDHGSGISTAAQRRAFESFFTTKPHGLGLGLSICSTIIHAHGGQLALVNHPDGGAQASFTLPTRRISVQ
jgi:PAS domain S-box-containing protein